MAGVAAKRIEGFDVLMAALVSDVLTTPGDADPAVRRTAFDAAARLARGEDVQASLPSGAQALPPDLEVFVDTIGRHAYRVTDRMVADLLTGGRSEDELFELILATAVGAGAARLEIGTRVVREAAGAPG
jgi:hypothetical protein